MLETSIFLEIPKSEILITPFVVDQDVGAFDVAVNDIASMEIGEAGDDLADERPDERFAECAVGVEHCLDGATGDILEENVEVFGRGTSPEILHDVWGVGGRGEGRFHA